MNRSVKRSRRRYSISVTVWGKSMSNTQLINVISNIERVSKDAHAQMSAPQLREGLKALYGPLPVNPRASFRTLDSPGFKGLHCTVPQGVAGKAILFLHGGGFVMGEPETFRTLIAEIAVRTTADVYALDYRRAPEHPYPAAFDDTVAAWCRLLQQGYAPESIALVGDSAGGGLCASLMLDLKLRCLALPSAAFLISPWLDLSMSGPSVLTKASVDPVVSPEGLAFFAQNYLRAQSHTTPFASPLFGDLAGLPPLLIHVGGNETLLDDSVRFAGKAGAAQARVRLDIWPQMIHEWHIWHSVLDEADAALEEGAMFLRAHLGIDMRPASADVSTTA